MQLYDYEQATKNIVQALRVDISPAGKMRILTRGPVAEIMTNRAWFADHNPHQLAVTLVGQRMQVAVDGAVVYDGPFPVAQDKRHLMGVFAVSGMKAELLGLEWRELLPAGP